MRSVGSPLSLHTPGVFSLYPDASQSGASFPTSNMPLYQQLRAGVPSDPVVSLEMPPLRGSAFTQSLELAPTFMDWKTEASRKLSCLVALAGKHQSQDLNTESSLSL